MKNRKLYKKPLPKVCGVREANRPSLATGKDIEEHYAIKRGERRRIGVGDSLIALESRLATL